ncbi:MAG TPA: hypothetical protein VGH31_06475 [Acidimicrobiales bacterium]
MTDSMTAGEPIARHVSGPGRRRVIPLAIVSVMSLIAVGAAVLAVGAGTPQSADAAVASAVTSALSDKTADFTLSGSAGISSLTIPITGTGSVDFTQNALQMQIGLPVPGSSQSLTEKVVELNKVIYVNVSGISQLLPGKSWISIDPSQFSGSDPTTSGLGLGSALPSSPADVLKLLSQGGNKATDLGPSTVNSQSVEGYSVTLDSAALQKAIAETKLPASISSSLPSLKLGSSLIGGGSHLGYQVFIAKATGQWSRVTTTIGLSIIGQTISDDTTMDFTNLGAPVDITIPPASEIVPYQQFLQDAKGATGSTV